MKDMPYQMIFKYIFLFSLIVLLGCREEKETVFFTNGNIKYEISLKNGKRDGDFIEYFKSGNICARGVYKKGQLNGKKIIYYENGNINEVHQYKEGVRCCESRYYYDNGNLLQIQYVKNGKVFDYETFKRNGDREDDIQSKSALIISEKDTLNEGEPYRAFIRLGNRIYDRIEVCLGDPHDRYILKTPKLPKRDSITVILNVSSEELHEGSNILEGVVVEVDERQGEKELIVVPFRHKIFVLYN